MPDATEEYQATLAGMREILLGQTRLIDAWLHMFKLNQSGVDAFKSGDPEVLRIVSTMIHMAGISAHSVLKLTQEISLQTRDCYPIARSIVESVVNIVFIMARGRAAAERADRHAQQKAYRDLQRKSSAGGWTVMVGSSVKLSPEDKAHLSALAAEFTTSRGREKRDWTDENLTERIDAAAKRFPEASVMLLHAALFNIYRHSSEVLHGTYFAAMHFWGLTTIGRPRPNRRGDLLRALSEHQFSILMSTIFAFTALIECVSDYVGTLELAEQASNEFKRLHELPLIKEALEESAGHGEGAPPLLE